MNKDLILAAIRNATDGIPQQAICAATGIQQPYVSRLLHKLRGQGLIERKPLRDGCKLVKWVGK